MRHTCWLGTLLLLPLFAAGAAGAGTAHGLERINRGLAGRLVDHTNNHGVDRRIWSAVLGERRELYVYLPPGFDPRQSYPVLLWLHGLDEDERTVIRERGLAMFDEAMASGKMPPTIIAIPDGTFRGRPSLYGINPLWANSRAGPFRDYLMQDVWGFVRANYPIRPGREAHAIGGFSGGGGAAYRIAFMYPPEFGVVFGVCPPLNLRWEDCRGRYFAPFDPDCWGWRTSVRPGRQPVARFYGVIVIRVRQLVYPLFGRGPEAVAELSRVNPIEMLWGYDVRPGEYAMYVAYGGRDQFNITAQVDSFLYVARQRGLCVQVGYDPRGDHSWRTARKLLPGVIDWLGQRLGPYGTP